MTIVPEFFSQALPGVAFTNGFVTVSSQGIQVLPHSPDHRATFGFPFSFHPTTPAPWFSKFLHDIFVEDLDAVEKCCLLQEFVGACLIGVSPRLAKALVLVGEGRKREEHPNKDH